MVVSFSGRPLSDESGSYAQAVGRTEPLVAFQRIIGRQELEGAALRALSALLQKLDPPGKWGGLQRVRTPDEKYLWLCERHIQEYKRPKASYDKPKK